MSLKGCNTTNSPLKFFSCRAWGIRKKKVMCCDQVVLHLIEVVTKIENTLAYSCSARTAKLLNRPNWPSSEAAGFLWNISIVPRSKYRQFFTSRNQMREKFCSFSFNRERFRERTSKEDKERFLQSQPTEAKMLRNVTNTFDGTIFFSQTINLVATRTFFIFLVLSSRCHR